MNIIEYITKKKSLTQKQIAEQLSVSGTQITKWKQGERIPTSHNEKLREIAGLIDDDLDWSLLVDNNPKNEEDWMCYVDEFYGHSDLWELERETISREVLTDLKNLGIHIPSNPENLKKETVKYDDGSSHSFIPLREILEQCGEDWDIRERWLFHFMDIRNEDFDYGMFSNVKSTATRISLVMVEDDLFEAAGADLEKLGEFRELAKKELRKEIEKYCEHLNELGTPFSVDYFRVVEEDWEEIDMDMYFWSLEKTAMRYASYPTKKAFLEIEELKSMVAHLHQKIDKLAEGNSKPKSKIKERITMDKQTKESLKRVAIYAKGKLLVDRYNYHKSFPDEPSLGPDMPHDILPLDVVKQAGGMGEVHKMRAAAIETVFSYLDSPEKEEE